jgi:hypothetical protein
MRIIYIYNDINKKAYAFQMFRRHMWLLKIDLYEFSTNQFKIA